MARPIYKRKKVWLLGLAVFFGFLVLLRDVLLARGGEFYISKTLAKEGWSVESINSSKTSTFLEGIKGKASSRDVSIQSASISWHLSLFPPLVEPKISLVDVAITFDPETSLDGPSFDSLGIILGTSFFVPRITVEEGKLLFPSSGHFFSFVVNPGNSKEEIGSFSIKEEGEEESFFKAYISKEKEKFLAKVEIAEGPIDSFLPWFSLFSSPSLSNWSDSTGSVSAFVKCIFDRSGHVEGMEANLDVKNIDLKNPLLDFTMSSKALKGTFSFVPNEEMPIWKQVNLFLTFEESSLLTYQNGDAFGFKDSLGELRLHPEEDPYLKAFGSVLSKGVFIPFEVEGKGEPLENGAYWLEANLQFFLSEVQPKITLSFCQNEDNESILQAECSHIVKEIVELSQMMRSFLAFPECKMEGGEIEGKLLCQFEQKKVKSLQLSDCKASFLDCSIPSKSLSFKAKELSFQGLLEQGETGVLELQSSHAEIHKASLQLGELQFKDISSILSVLEGQFEPSYIEGSYEGIKTSLQILALSASSLLHVECGAYPRDLIDWLSKEKGVKGVLGDPIFLAFDLREEDGFTSFSGTARLASSSTSGVEEDLEIEGRIDKQISRKLTTLFSPWDVSSCRGSFSMDKLSAKTMIPYIETLLGFYKLQGTTKVKGTFDKKGLEMAFSEVDLILSDKATRISAELGDKDPVLICYNGSTNEWEGSFPLNVAFIEDKASSFGVEMSDTVFSLKKGRFWTSEWKAKIENIEAIGELSFEGDSLEVLAKKYSGKLVDLSSVLQKITQSPSPISLKNWTGDFEAPYSGSLIIGVQKEGVWSWDWSVCGLFKGISSDFEKMGTISEGKAIISLDSKGIFDLKEVEASYANASLACKLSLKDFHWAPGERSDFCLSAKEGSREWLLFLGSIEKEKEGFIAHIDPLSHVLGIQCKIAPIEINQGRALPPVLGEFSLKLQQLPSYISMGRKLGFFENIDIPSLGGDLRVQLSYDLRKSDFLADLYSPSLSYEGSVIGEMRCRVEKKGNSFEVKPSTFGPYHVKMKAEAGPKEWEVSSLSVESPDVKLSAEGSYFPLTRKASISSFSTFFRKEEKELKAKGSFEGVLSERGNFLQGKGECYLSAVLSSPYALEARPTKKLSFFLDSTKGVEVEKSQWEIFQLESKKLLASASIKNIRGIFKEERLLIEKGSITMTQEGLSVFPESIASIFSTKEPVIQIEADLSKNAVKVSGTLKNDTYIFSRQSFECKQVRFLIEQDEMYASCQTFWQKEPVWLQLQSRQGATTSATLLIKEEPSKPGLALQLMQSAGGLWRLEAAQGNFKGLDVQVLRKGPLDKKGLLYEAKVQADFSKMAALFPKKSLELVQKWGLGQGYLYQGTALLNPTSFEITSLDGELLGKDFQLLGRNLRSFKARVHFDGDRVQVKGASLEDEAGSLSIKALDLFLDKKTGEWSMAAPLIHVKEFSPSLLMKGKKEGTLIRNLSFYNLKGSFGALETFEGTGALNFTSTAKKEASFWDGPVNLIKDLGLDPGVLNPIVGEVDFSVIRGRCYFTALRNVYSEGDRAQFDLADPGTDAYLSLDGTWHVDLQMKQNALWKVAEGLVLSIRGTLEKPKYSLKLKESL